MKKILIVIFLFGITMQTVAQQWKAADVKIKTSWGEQLNPSNVLPEYPRPQLVRDEWKNLNGLWDYSIQPRFNGMTETFTHKILVPFAIESSLSGVGRIVGKENLLWYRTKFDIPEKWEGKRIILHFGAVDWEADVYVNKKKVGSHRGGYDSFSFDITDQLIKSGEQEIQISVWDPSDDGFQPRGKQVKKTGGIWYTSVTGIWQTVWLEPVNQSYIRATKQTPDIDKNQLNLDADVTGWVGGDKIIAVAYDGIKEVARKEFNSPKNLFLKIDEQKLWTPDNPFLYDLKISLMRDGKVIDEVKSYFAMRKISLSKDENGIQRMMLNNKFLFQFGTLDQGWWPEGLYTAPSDEALAFDIVKLKELGFNLIRKHVKVEPARYYYHCDRLGILVWQDMPSGDMDLQYGDNGEQLRNAQSEYQYETELKAIIDEHYNFPSIIVWVPFNEGWGQSNTIKICNWITHYDSSRLVDGPSGWTDLPAAGNMQDRHDYPGPSMPIDKKDNRALVLGEFGGLGLPIEGHTWKDKDNWGYRSYKNIDELQKAFIALIEKIPALISKGLSAAVYTQTTDVEVEVNGVMTYDRKIIKLENEKIKTEIKKLYDVVK